MRFLLLLIITLSKSLYRHRRHTICRYKCFCIYSCNDLDVSFLDAGTLQKDCKTDLFCDFLHAPIETNLTSLKGNLSWK
jgi:hypothetical protein